MIAIVLSCCPSYCRRENRQLLFREIFTRRSNRPPAPPACRPAWPLPADPGPGRPSGRVRRQIVPHSRSYAFAGPKAASSPGPAEKPIVRTLYKGRSPVGPIRRTPPAAYLGREPTSCTVVIGRARTSTSMIPPAGLGQGRNKDGAPNFSKSAVRASASSSSMRAPFKRSSWRLRAVTRSPVLVFTKLHVCVTGLTTVVDMVNLLFRFGPDLP